MNKSVSLYDLLEIVRRFKGGTKPKNTDEERDQVKGRTSMGLEIFTMQAGENFLKNTD